MKKKTVNICADDYALSPGVSRGIRELLEQQHISGTSVMTLSNFWPSESKALQLYANTADIGLHFTLTDLKPLTKMPQFAPEGKLPSLKKILYMAYSNILPLDEIASELLRQFTTFVEFFGNLPTHLDGHQHIHLLPGIREIIIKLYKKHCNNSTIYIRNCCRENNNLFKYPDIIKANILHYMGKSLKKQLLQNNIPTNINFAGVYNFFAKNVDFSKTFERFLKSASGANNTVIMCHPGYVDTTLESIDSVVLQREQELKFFKSAVFSAMLAKHNLRLYNAQL